MDDTKENGELVVVDMVLNMLTVLMAEFVIATEALTDMDAVVMREEEL